MTWEKYRDDGERSDYEKSGQWRREGRERKKPLNRIKIFISKGLDLAKKEYSRQMDERNQKKRIYDQAFKEAEIGLIRKRARRMAKMKYEDVGGIEDVFRPFPMTRHSKKNKRNALNPYKYV
jgi:hypothetical protein